MFKRGSEYSRDEIAMIACPDNPPRGGNWTTGYAKVGEKVFVFMNIGVPGRTGHDFENYYDEKTQSLVWFSKPDRNSTHQSIRQMIAGDVELYFFARWRQRSRFTFLGIGTIVSFQDGFLTSQGHTCVKFIVSVKDLDDIIHRDALPPPLLKNCQDPIERSAFVFEKHLEDFLVSNWDKTPLAVEYEIYKGRGEGRGRQFRTDIGPIDILAQKRDQSDFLVVELKRDLASDIVVGQTHRYMGWVKTHLCGPLQNVTGCIIAQHKDQKLDYALVSAQGIQFMRYEMDFRLTG